MLHLFQEHISMLPVTVFSFGHEAACALGHHWYGVTVVIQLFTSGLRLQLKVTDELGVECFHEELVFISLIGLFVDGTPM